MYFRELSSLSLCTLESKVCQVGSKLAEISLFMKYVHQTLMRIFASRLVKICYLYTMQLQNITFLFRFMPPQSPVSWTGVKYAMDLPPACPQVIPNLENKTHSLLFMTQGRYNYLRKLFPYLQNRSEDCLYLNIYAPIEGK